MTIKKPQTSKQNPMQQFAKGKVAEALHKAYCTHLGSGRGSCVYPNRIHQISAALHSCYVPEDISWRAVDVTLAS